MARGRPVRIDVGVRVVDGPARHLVEELAGHGVYRCIGCGHGRWAVVKSLGDRFGSGRGYDLHRLAGAAVSRKCHSYDDVGRSRSALTIRLLAAV